MNAFARAALWMASEKRERLTPSVRAGLLAPYDSWAHRIAIQRFVEDIPMHSSHVSYPTLVQIEERLSLLTNKPISLIWGMRDWCFTPEMLERFRAFFPQAEIHRLEDAGHYVIEDAYERIVPIVADFLRRHPVSFLHSAAAAS
jgi:cis-3-alkyl-4-acyloxetan-2-one decarboxylase